MVPYSESTNTSPPLTGGQLDIYRKQATFKLQNMRIAIEDPERTAIKMKVWSYLESDPAYWPTNKILSSDEEKHKTAKLLEKFRNSKLFDNIHSWDYKTRTRYLITLNQAVEMLNANLSIKFALGVSLFANALLCLGTQRHLKYYKDVWSGKILSCLAITELAHGSDTKRLKTTATYDHLTNELVLNTPNIGAAKCWVGNLGRQSTHALLFAQLIVDNVCHGLHAFIVPIRDPDTLIPYPNITVGDIGEKDGLHGIDNGYVIFHYYRIPKECLLNKIGDINENGEYETAFTNPQELLGAALESLSAGRVAILQESSNTLIKAIVIAVRYAAQRLQFSDSEGNELPILEYQTHQWRLFPYLAASYAFKSFMHDFDEQYINLVADSREGRINVAHLPQMVKGIHAIVCTTKALITWTTQTAIQECREACGGHGYHKAAGFGDLRSNHDPRVTFEGDNTVLLQQTSNWILRLYSDSDLDSEMFPLSEVSFLKNKDIVLQRKYRNDVSINSDKFIMETYEWLICWLCKSTLQKIDYLRKQQKDKFLIRNQSQVYKARTLSLVFAEFLILTYFIKKCKSCSPDVRPVLCKLFNLYGLWSLHKHLAVIYQGGYCEGPSFGEGLSEAVLRLCSELKPEVVSLTDAIAPPDFVLNSILGCSDGKIYERLMEAFNLPDSSANFNEDSILLQSKL